MSEEAFIYEAIRTPRGRYTLLGDVPAELEGKRVTVQGSKASSMGFLMTGDPQIEVRSIRKA